MNNVEDIYELSPMQQGLLFHTWTAPASGAYIIQSHREMEGAIDTEHFQSAWNETINRHPALRTSFHWEDIEKPLQVVHKKVSLEINVIDWRGIAESEQQARIDTFLKTDRTKGFDLTTPPLMRVTLIRTGDQVHHFVWSFHHIILDGWSSSLVFQDAVALYEALQNKTDLQLNSARPYRDYIRWLQGRDMLKARSFWQQKLNGFYGLTSPAADHRRALAGEPSQYKEERLHLPDDLKIALQEFCKKNQLTLSTMFQAAWALLLSRYTCTQDVVFGVTVSGRPGDLAGAESMVGLFINTLPARINVKPHYTLLTWLREVQAQQVEMNQYDYTPLVEIQACSQVPRGSPLFESIYIFENYKVDAASRKPGLNLKARKGRSIEQTTYPLTMVVEPGPSIALRALYDCALFHPGAITQMLGHFRSLLTQVTADRQRLLCMLSPLTERERSELVVGLNRTAADYEQDRCIHQLFEGQAERTPDSIAVSFGRQQLTYKELNKRANRLARRLRAAGVGLDQPVGIYLDRSIQMVVAILAALKAGGAYLPLDPSYPHERLAFMVEDSQAAVVVTQSSLLDSMPGRSATAICLEAERDLIEREREENLNIEVDADNLAYVIYTSGSTGRPKGALIAHRGLCSLSQAQTAMFNVRGDDHVLQFSSLSFDAATFEIVMALLKGARLCLGTQEELFPGPTLFNFLRDNEVNIVTLPPSALSALPAGELPSLKVITVAGEAMPARLVGDWGKRHKLFNLYGPTESTIWATAHLCNDPSQDPPIGLPIANTRVYLLDEWLEPVPVGVKGELHIAGVGLARAYLNRPRLTSDRFIPDPFSGEPGARMYRTGDLCRYTEDGGIEFLGRVDHQVKIRGFRVELGEIESALCDHEAVRDCIVVVREDNAGDKRLAAYITANGRQGVAPDELRAFLRQRLPGYMLPSAFVELAEFPLTPSGKVDRNALPKPDGARRHLGSDYAAPRTDLEKAITSAWQSVLQVDRVGLYDNFFDLGGHSLLMIQIHNKLREALSPDLQIVNLFKYPTVSALAKHLANAHEDDSDQKFETHLERIDEGKNRMAQLRRSQSSAKAVK